LVLNLSYSRCGPCGPFGNVALVPGTDLTPEDDPPAFGVDRDHLGAPLQRFLNFLPYLGRMDRGRDANVVGDVSDPGELMHGVLGIGSLKLPIDLARQGHDPVFHLDLDAIGRKPDLPLQDVDCTRRGSPTL